MKIALLGYGKMGHIIEQIAIKRGHTISHAIHKDNANDLEQVTAATTDVAIEFSEPGAAFRNIMHCLENGVPVVCGTTGWLDKKATVEAYCQEQNGAFFYASNFSLGVNVFFRLNELLAEMMDRFPEFEVDIEEIHHIHKKDAPSGTALTLAEGIIRHLQRKNSWELDKKENEEAVTIHSKREGEVPGTHTVTYRSAVDDIEIKHTAHNRQGFALGAVKVAEWLPSQKGVKNMRDFLRL
ncbi:4-hydroxy-tetrahydrodipicolinate reductase [Nafulsella turpanensis]|uniref:4-hydroxy-tetrahydrodipicolinate reductase n=1 Tax=Nafulsella turpanensis TaxID=1265690 RepID=UPI00034CA107|nr:4-hydroxy-tetrahydrodipicolinate reductase [Nafulsella turpanensis]